MTPSGWMTRRLIEGLVLTIGALGLWFAHAEVFDLFAMLMMSFVAFRAAIGAAVGDRRMKPLLALACALLMSMIALQFRAGAIAAETATKFSREHVCAPSLPEVLATDRRWKKGGGGARLDLEVAGATRYLIYLPDRGISSGFMYSRALMPLAPCT
jgi:hypothetical protein